MFFEPLYARIDAFTALGDELSALETTDGLIRCAVAVSMHELEHEADTMLVLSALDDFADQVQDRVFGTDPRALLAHTHQVLFDEARFRGNKGEYDDPSNSYLTRVLQTRLGLPITLAMIYKAVLDRLGLPAVGINAPGHFLAGVPATAVGALGQQETMAIIDPFDTGRLLSRAEALDRIAQTAGGDLLLDEDTDLLAIATHKQWLIRLIRNLYMGFDRRGQRDDASAMAEMMRLVEAQG